MSTAIWVSKTGAAAQDAKMGVIAHNLANVNTGAFKREAVIFENLDYQNQRIPGSPLDQNNASPIGIQFGSGVKIVGTQKQFTLGSLNQTGEEMNVAITGQGFLQVEMTDGSLAYTRTGSLNRNADGVLTNAQGLPLIPQIELPANTTKINIAADGTVSANVGGENEPAELGQLTLVNFVNPAGLEAIGGNLYKETVASGEAVEGVAGEESFGQLKQGALEGSNVQVVEEMVDMITVQRGYEMNVKMISAADEMMKTVIQKM